MRLAPCPPGHRRYVLVTMFCGLQPMRSTFTQAPPLEDSDEAGGELVLAASHPWFRLTRPD